MKVIIVLSVMGVLALSAGAQHPPHHQQASYYSDETADTYYRGPQVYYRAPRAAEIERVQRQAGGGDHHDVTDFGAHTGHHGAFGWYADFPVHAHGN